MTFAKIKNEMMDWTPPEIKVYAAICLLQLEGRMPVFGHGIYAAVALKARMSERQVRRTMDKLRKQIDLSEGVVKNVTQEDINVNSVDKNVTVPDTNVHPKLPPPIIKNNKKEYMVKIAALFDRFWSEYPRKVSKKPANVAFEKIMREQKDHEAFLDQKILPALAKQKRKWDDPRYIPHASTWLNQERWNDEDATTSSGLDKYDHY